MNKKNNIVLNTRKKSKLINKFTNIVHIDIFATIYVENIATSFEKIINELNITTTLNIRQITNDDINICIYDNSRYMFLFCPQYVYPYNADLNQLPPRKYFFYQLEQLDKSESSYICNPFVFLTMLHAKHIFDYSSLNLLEYKKIHASLSNNSLLIPPIVNIEQSKHMKIFDVLFTGCNSVRRTFILESLKSNGINVTFTDSTFGNNLTCLIKKSKIFLNIRYSDSNILETCRLHEAIMSSDTYIISEKPGNNKLGTCNKPNFKLDSSNYYTGRIIFIDVINNNTDELVKIIKKILSIYDRVKPNKFNENIIMNNIKHTLINIFKSC